MTIIFTFPLEQGKENDVPFIISSLAFIPVNQKQKMSSDSLFPTCPNSPPGMSLAWMQHKLASELVSLEITDTFTAAANKVSATKKL